MQHSTNDGAFLHKIKSDDTEVGLKSNLDKIIVDAGTGDADLSRSDAICPDVGGHFSVDIFAGKTREQHDFVEFFTNQ